MPVHVPITFHVVTNKIGYEIKFQSTGNEFKFILAVAYQFIDMHDLFFTKTFFLQKKSIQISYHEIVKINIWFTEYLTYPIPDMICF